MAVALVAASVVGASAFLGCSQVLGIDSNRYLTDAGGDASDASSSATDAAVDGSDASDGQADSGLPANWQCIDTPVPPTPDASVEFEMFISDVSGMQSSGSFNGTPIADAQVQACDRLDFSCGTPITQAMTNDGGIALLNVPGGFNGYYTLVANGYVSSLLQRPPQLQSESGQNAMVSPNTLSLGEQVANVNQDPKNAVSIVTLEDCNDQPAVGATFEVSNPGPNEQVVYFQDRLPTMNATSTDVTGSALIFNVPAGSTTGATTGSMTVTAYMAGHRPVRGLTALTRAGWVTFMQIRPDQATVVHP